jgi:hypothetical protein
MLEEIEFISPALTLLLLLEDTTVREIKDKVAV